MEKTVIFDLDGTLIQGQSQKMMALRLWHEGQISIWIFVPVIFWFLLYKIGIAPNVSWVMRKAYSLLKGIKTKELDRILETIIREEIKPKIFPQALEKIRDFQKRGYEVGIVSTSINPLIEILVKELHLDFGIGTKLEDNNGSFTGRIRGKVLYGLEKANQVQQLARQRGWNLAESYAFTDSYSDIPLLKLVGRPVAINPDHHLKKKAQSLHWPIYSWDIPFSSTMKPRRIEEKVL